MKRHVLPIIILAFGLTGFGAFAQPYTLKVKFRNQPGDRVVLGMVRGDKFLPVDTLFLVPAVGEESFVSGEEPLQGTGNPVVKTGTYRFPFDGDAGVYRLILGRTTYAKVMGEAPQQLDFIFNGEDVMLETDFKAPQDSLRVMQSEENRVWYAFLQRQKEFRRQLDELEVEMDYYWNLASEAEEFVRSEAGMEQENIRAKAAEKANAFNQLQLERERQMHRLAEMHRGLFAAKLIRSCGEPFRDGYLNLQERKASVQKRMLLYPDFTDEALINSSVLTDRVFDYLVTWNRPGYSKTQREEAYIKAVDNVMTEVTNSEELPDGKMYPFILTYLTDGFEKLGMENVIGFLAEKYAGGLCKSDEKTTLERKLEASQQKIGSLVPDFTLNDMEGQPVTLSHRLKDRNLLLFWASWCPHCNDLLSGIKSWLERNPVSGIEVFAISLDTDRSEWENAVHDAGMEGMVNLSDLKGWDGAVAEAYNIYATPTMYLIAPDRKIEAKPTSLQELWISLP